MKRYYKEAAQRIITHIRELRASPVQPTARTSAATSAATSSAGDTEAMAAAASAVLSSPALQESVLASTQSRTPNTLHVGCSIGLIRAFYMRKIKFTDEGFTQRLQMVIHEFTPAAVVDAGTATVGSSGTGGAGCNMVPDNLQARTATAVAQVRTCNRIINAIAVDCVKLLWIASSVEKCKALKRGCYGRMCTACHKIEPCLAYLEAVRLSALLPGDPAPSDATTLSATPAISHLPLQLQEKDLKVEDWGYDVITSADALLADRFDETITACLDALELQEVGTPS